jgi:hypothetical protein
MEAATVTAITDMFTGIATQIVPIMTPIAVSAVPVFVVFVSIRYGKALWQAIAKPR